MYILTLAALEAALDLKIIKNILNAAETFLTFLHSQGQDTHSNTLYVLNKIPIFSLLSFFHMFSILEC